MKRFWILTLALARMHLRNRMTLFWNLVFPVFLLGIYSLVFSQQAVDGINYMAWVLPGVLVLNILSFGLMSSSSTMVEMRERGVLRRLQATPVPALSLVGAYLSVNVIICLLQSALIVAAGVLVLGVQLTPLHLLRSLPMILLAILMSVGMGQIVSGVAVKAGIAVALGQFLYFSQMFITDMVMPLAMLPEWLQAAAVYLPGYTMVQLVRPPMIMGTWSPQVGLYLALSLGYTLAAGLLAAALFRWAPKE